MFALLMIAVAPAQASAGPADPPLRLETRVLTEARTPAPDGTTQVALVAPRHVLPGDRMVVQVTYRNGSTQPLGGLVIANPVPPDLVYHASASGSPVPEVSVDGERFGTLESLRVALPEGGTRAARADDIRQVRWRVPGVLAAGAAGRLAFRATVK